MEDSSLEWEKLEDEGEVEKGSGFGWVLSKGLNLGKNLVITGVVVSSVPIVVPPLLVVSALGFAFSVPFGFMFASYTCTEKLMSKLLPNSSPHVIEYGEGEIVECEEKGKGDDGYSEGMIYYQEELADENGVILVEENGVILVKENEEGLSTASEFGKDKGGLQYDDINRSEEVLSTVCELGEDEEGLRYDDVNRCKEGLSTVSELGKDEEDLRSNNVNTTGEGLRTGTEFGKDEEGSLKNDGNISEEVLGTITELGKDGEGLQKEDINRNGEGLSTVTESGKDEEGSLKDDINRSEEGLSITELGKNGKGSQKDDVNMSEEGVLSGTGFKKDEERSRKNDDINIIEAGLTTGAEFGKGEEGLQKDDMKREDADGNRASDAVLVTGDLDVPNKEHMQYGVIDNKERSVEEIGVEVYRSGIEESRETKATDDAISQVQTAPSVVEMNDDRSKKEVTERKAKDKIDTKLGGEKNDVHGSKGTDKGKKRHTNAKGKKKAQKTLKRVEGDVSKAHEKDLVESEIVSGKADGSLESENKLNLDKNEMQLSAQDVAEEKITGVIMISKDNGEPGNLSTSIGDIDENNKNAGLLESETTTNEPRVQASTVSVLVPVLELSDSKSVPVLIQHEELVDLKDDSVHVGGNGLIKNKEMLGEEEIWKQIDSIRTIVGFKVARHTSYFEELKALYVFTGIEPPSLFKDPLDTAEVCDSLRFLMSVIGVK